MKNTQPVQVKINGQRMIASFIRFTGNSTERCMTIGTVEDPVVEEAQAAYDKALKRGHTVEANGVKQWIQFHEILRDGLEVCKGDKTYGERILFTKYTDGSITREVLGTSWRKITD